MPDAKVIFRRQIAENGKNEVSGTPMRKPWWRAAKPAIWLIASQAFVASMIGLTSPKGRP